MKYAMYSPGVTLEAARAAFVARYCYEPQVVKKHNVWLLGPKPGDHRPFGR